MVTMCAPTAAAAGLRSGASIERSGLAWRFVLPGVPRTWRPGQLKVHAQYRSCPRLGLFVLQRRRHRKHAVVQPPSRPGLRGGLYYP